MAAQTRRVLVPRLDDHFEEPVIDEAILEGFQKLVRCNVLVRWPLRQGEF